VISWSIEREVILCAYLWPARKTCTLCVEWLLEKNLLWLAKIAFSYFVLRGNKILLVLVAKVIITVQSDSKMDLMVY